MTTGGHFEWNEEHQKAFEEMKALIANNALLQYTDPNFPFHIYTDAAEYQLGAKIMQNDQPGAYYLHKLNAVQRNYMTMEKEVQSIMQTFKEYQPLLYGTEIHVHTDHRNLTYANLNSQRIIHWHLFIVEFHPQFHYITGPNNVLADAVSPVPRSSEEEEKNAVDKAAINKANTSTSESFFALEIDDISLTTCLLQYPNLPENIIFSLKCGLIADQQATEGHWSTQNNAGATAEFSLHAVGTAQSYFSCQKQDKLRKICIPETLVIPILKWYHERLNHIGMTRLNQTIALHFYHPHLK